MKATTLFLVALVGLTTVVGCSADKSGDVQTMPKSASAPNDPPKNPNLPPQAADAISRAAPGAGAR